MRLPLQCSRAGRFQSVLMAAMLLSAGCFAPEARLPPERIRSVPVLVGGEGRHVLLYVPQAIEQGSPRLYPLVMVFHERDGNPQSIVKLSRNRWQELAEAHQFFLALPVAADGSWDRSDNVLFVRLLIDELVRNFPVDPSGIYAAGFGEGAFFTLRLLCEAPDRFRSLAIIAGGMRPGQVCNFTHPVSVLIAHGTADPVVPFGGGEIRMLRTPLGQALPFVETVKRLRNGLGCKHGPVRRSDRFPQDGTSLTMESYTCNDETRLKSITIHGGGHTWPGGWSPTPPEIVGPVSAEWNATESSVEFFFTDNKDSR